MALKLVFQGGEHPQVPLAEGSCCIGSALDADIPLGHDGIEPLHCELLVGAHGVRLRVIPGARVLVNERSVDGVIALRGNDVLRLADVKARLVDAVEEAPRAATIQGRDEGSDLNATMVRPVVPKFALRAVSGALFGRSFPLQASLNVGRAEDAGLRIPLDSISRQHARLTPAANEVLVEDLGSANGTWLNGRRVTRASAAHGDEISFDKERFQLLVPGQPVVAPKRSRRTTGARWPWLLAALLAGAALATWLIL
ncbi:MAG TPA: FHA domain-containing protein [Thermomonas sp.]|nr:FHA domain-containing protein [Thermomonas sp.]